MARFRVGETGMWPSHHELAKHFRTRAPNKQTGGILLELTLDCRGPSHGLEFGRVGRCRQLGRSTLGPGLKLANPHDAPKERPDTLMTQPMPSIFWFGPLNRF
jgi:hypothetical protein